MQGARCAEHPIRPAMGTCERCGSFYCESCTGRSDGGATFCGRCWEGRGYVPWEDPELGVFAAFFETVKRSLTELPRFARELPARGGLGRPLAFAMAPSLLGALLLSGAMGLFMGAIMPAVLPEGAPPSALWFALGVFLGYFVGLSVSYALYLLLWPLPLLVCAKLFGGRRPATYEGFFRALCYSSGLNLFHFVPGIGLLVLGYHAAVSIACIAKQLDAGVGRAAAIYLVPLGTFMLGCGGVYVGLIVLGLQASA